MFERFTERARQVVVLAQDEASQNEQGYIGCEHILAGLIREEDGLAAKVLLSMGVVSDKVHDLVIAKASGARSTNKDERPELTLRARKVLELALREALSLGHNYIGTEHVLLGLLREGDNIALGILRDDFSLSADKIREEVMRMLSGPKAPILGRDKESRPKVYTNGLAPMNVDELLNLAIVLARQHPEIPATRIIAAARALV